SPSTRCHRAPPIRRLKISIRVSADTQGWKAPSFTTLASSDGGELVAVRYFPRGGSGLPEAQPGSEAGEGIAPPKVLRRSPLSLTGNGQIPQWVGEIQPLVEKVRVVIGASAVTPSKVRDKETVVGCVSIRRGLTDVDHTGNGIEQKEINRSRISTARALDEPT